MSILSPEDLDEFRQIWLEEFGEPLEPDKTEAIAERFLSALHLIVTLSDRADQKTQNAKTKEDVTSQDPPKSAM